MTGTAECVVLWLALEPATPDDADRLETGLQRLAADDALLRARPREAGQVIIAGVSETHLETVLDRLRREFRVAATVGKLQVAYREALTAAAEGRGRFVRATGSRSHYADVAVHLAPLPTGAGFRFDNRLARTAIPDRYIASILEGLQHALERGLIAGCPVEDVAIDLVDGSYHEADSSDAAFKIAAAMAFQDAGRKAHPILTEPVMRLEVRVPARYLAAVATDLRRRHAQLEAYDTAGDTQVLHARVPLRVLLGYEAHLHYLTAGRARHSLVFDRFEPVRGDTPGDQQNSSLPTVPRTWPNARKSGLGLPEPDER